MQFRVRPATPADAAGLADLARQIWTEYYTAIIGAAQVEYMLARFQSAEQIAADLEGGFRYWLGEAGPLAVGYAAAQPRGDHLFLSKVYVRADQRGQGVARAFVDEALDWCRQLGLGRVRLTVNKHNPGAIQAYHRMGFATRQAVVTDIGAGFVMDDYVMELDLSADRAPGSTIRP
jgi:GNAT superfamily N-acetyltransferase